MTNKAVWHSPSGPIHFGIYRMAGDWNDVGGVYVFAAEGISGYASLYIGKAASFRDRLSCHDRWDEAARAGATCVLAKIIHTESERCALEEAMIRHLQPALNTQHRGLAALFERPAVERGGFNSLAEALGRSYARAPVNALLGLTLAEAGGSSKRPAPSGLGALRLDAVENARPSRRRGLSGL